MISTKIVKVDPLNPRENDLDAAVEVIRKGGLVIIPTETVYGIAADMLNKKAMERLYEIKARPKDKPFSIIIDEKARIEEFAIQIPVSAYKLINKFWPGPLTLVLKSKGQGTVGLRMPDDQIASRIISKTRLPLVCPSANISGKPAPVTFEEAIVDLNGQVDFAIDSGKTRLGIESSVVDLSVEPWQMLREKAVKKENIEAVTQKKIVLFVCTGNTCRSVMAKGLLEKKIKEQGRQDNIQVLSRGIMPLSGLDATPQTKELLLKEDINVSGHLSQRVDREVIKKSDLILVMEPIHQERILQLVPEVKNRVFLLKEFAKISDGNLDVMDPISKPMEIYSRTFAVIKEAIERISSLI